MPARKKGTQEQINSIKALLQDDAIKTDPSYRPAWIEMCKAAALDASYNCTLTSKALRKSKIGAFADLHIPDVTLPTFRLSLPSLAFVYMKLFKNLDVKLGKAGRGNLNLSHAPDWVATVEELQDYIAAPVQSRHPQILDPNLIYTVIPADELANIRSHSLGATAGQSSNPLCASDDEYPDDVLTVN